MIKENNFNALAERAREHKYSSMSYIDFDDCKNACILHDCDELILLQDKSKTPAMLYFATDNFQLVIDAIAQISGAIKLHFVPREFAGQLEHLGFTEWGEFFDFFNTNLSATAASLGDIGTIEYLMPDECEAAATVSKRCELQSRGFESIPAEHFMEYLNDGDVIICRKDSAIAGFCVVTIYNEGTMLWIRALAVDPAYQSMGLGKKLIEQAITYGVQKGAVKAFLHADVLNKNAIGLYNKYNLCSKYKDGELQMVRKGQTK